MPAEESLETGKVPTTESENEPYTRWQGFRITQLGFCIGLFLTYSVAILGFLANMLVQLEYSVTGFLAKLFFISSGVCGLLSLALGISACLTRLYDFRTTARVAKNRWDTTQQDQVNKWRKTSDCLGKWTWGLFWAQTITFALQAASLVVTLCNTYWDRLRV